MCPASITQAPDLRPGQASSRQEILLLSAEQTPSRKNLTPHINTTWKLEHKTIPRPWNKPCPLRYQWPLQKTTLQVGQQTNHGISTSMWSRGTESMEISSGQHCSPLWQVNMAKLTQPRDYKDWRQQRASAGDSQDGLRCLNWCPVIYLLHSSINSTIWSSLHSQLCESLLGTPKTPVSLSSQLPVGSSYVLCMEIVTVCTHTHIKKFNL